MCKINKLYYSNHYSSLDQDPAVQAFIKAFKEKNKDVEPDAFNALGYDLAKFTCDAIGRADKLDGESVKKALASTKDFKGVTGTITVDTNHNAQKSIVVIQLENGKPKSSVKAGG